MATAKVYVRYKPDVMDPQGITVKKALETLGYKGVNKVSVGRYFLIELDGNDREAISRNVKKMSTELLSNPVIEDYTFEIEEN